MKLKVSELFYSAQGEGRYVGVPSIFLRMFGCNFTSPEEHLAYLDTVLPGWVTKQETRVKMHEQSINLNKDPRKSGMTKVTRL